MFKFNTLLSHSCNTVYHLGGVLFNSIKTTAHTAVFLSYAVVLFNEDEQTNTGNFKKSQSYIEKVGKDLGSTTSHLFDALSKAVQAVGDVCAMVYDLAIEGYSLLPDKDTVVKKLTEFYKYLGGNADNADGGNANNVNVGDVVLNGDVNNENVDF